MPANGTKISQGPHILAASVVAPLDCQVYDSARATLPETCCGDDGRPSNDRQLHRSNAGFSIGLLWRAPRVGGTFHFEILFMAPLTKTCPKMVLSHKGGSLCVKDVFAKKFFGAGRDSAGDAPASVLRKHPSEGRTPDAVERCIRHCAESRPRDRYLPPRSRTIQVYPKNVGMLPRQPKRAVSCPSGFRRGAYALRHKAPIHHAPRRRCGGLAAHCARAAADACDRVSSSRIALRVCVVAGCVPPRSQGRRFVEGQNVTIEYR